MGWTHELFHVGNLTGHLESQINDQNKAWLIENNYYVEVICVTQNIHVCTAVVPYGSETILKYLHLNNSKVNYL